MTEVEIVWSIQVFFFKPARIPKPIPNGTEITTEIMLIFKETGKRSAIIAIALASGSICVERPQSNLVTMLPNHSKYWSTIGRS